VQYTAADRENIDNGTPDIIRLNQEGLRQALDRAITFGGCSSGGSGGAFPVRLLPKSRLPRSGNAKPRSTHYLGDR
jgi:hypothetical protein